MKHILTPVLLSTYLLLLACGDDGKEEAKENNVVWSTYASGSYEYDILELCNCPAPSGFHTIVFDGKVFSTTAIGPDIDSADNANAITTIEQLFDIAGQYGVKTTYNNQYGFPERLEITPTDTATSASPADNIQPSGFTAGFEVKNFALIENF